MLKGVAMLTDINLPLILLAAFVASSSPGPATLALAGTSMASGRAAGLALASGITTGSLIWSVAAAMGLGGLMLANAWEAESTKTSRELASLDLRYDLLVAAQALSPLNKRVVEDLKSTTNLEPSRHSISSIDLYRVD